MVGTKQSKTTRSLAAQSFLFVNKNKGSKILSQSEKREKTRILSHVRNQHRNDAPIHIPWMQYASIIDTSEDDNKCENGYKTRLLINPAKSQREERRLDPIYLRQVSVPQLEQGYDVYQLILQNQPSYNSLDPFHCTIGGLEVTAALHSFGNQVQSKIARTTFCAECLEPLASLEMKQSSRHDDARAKRLRACVDNELLLYSSIAHGYASMAWSNGQIGSHRSQIWIRKTMEALRERLGACITDNRHGIVMCIFTLTLTSLWNAIPRLWLEDPYETSGDGFEACRIHIHAMIQVVECAGGWHKVDPYILEGIILADKYAAIYKLQKPLIPITFDPGRESVDLLCTSVSTVPPIPNAVNSFSDLGTEPELATILQDIDHFYRSARLLWQGNKIVTSEDEHMLYRRFQALHYKLLIFNSSDSSSQLVQLTSLAVLCNMPQYAAGPLFCHVMLGHLQKKMTEILSTRETINSKVWIWCLSVAATTKLVARHKVWFVSRFLRQMSQNGITLDAHSIHQALKPYVSLPWIDDAELQQILKWKKYLTE